MPVRVAIVGRPNVGKSTLFNRLAGKKLAIVDDQPGVTRDRKEAIGRIADLPLVIIDTAGFEDVNDGSLEARMRRQTELAIDEADVILFMIDARSGVTPMDERFAELLRGASKPIIVAANKCEGREAEAGVYEAYALGLGEPLALSGEHGEGISELYQAIVEAVPGARDEEALDVDALAAEYEAADEDDEEIEIVYDDDGNPISELDFDEPPPVGTSDKPAKLIVVGRPNAGKSTLINALLQSDRLLTGPEAGITRDSVAVDWTWEGRTIRLVDTAGLRKKAKVQERLERYSTHETIRSIRFSDVVALVMDAHEAFEKQDLQIANLCVREGRGMVFVISKWDTVDDPSLAAKSLREMASKLLPNAKGTPLVFLSGLTGRGIEKLMPAVSKVLEDWNAKVRTSDLNTWLRHAMERNPAPSVHGKPIKPRYITQVKARPPTFVLMASRGDQMPESYKRFLVNGIREAFDLPGVPIRLFVRQGKNPYANKK